MQASQIVTLRQSGHLKAVRSFWSLIAAVFGRELDMTDTDALCSLAAIKYYSN